MELIKNLILKGISEFYRYKIVSIAITAIVTAVTIFGIASAIITNELEYIFEVLFGIAFCSCLFFAIFGIIESIIQLPFSLKREKYKKMFESIGFKSANDEYPSLVKENETEFLTILTFRSKIPLKEWHSKKNLIETFLNARIANLINAEHDNNIVHIQLVKKDLPDNLIWQNRFMINNNNELNLGVCYDGNVILDLDKNAHVFIAGETGSGKSNILKGLIYQSITKGHSVKLVDFKRGVSFSVFANLIDIYSEYQEIDSVLNELVKTMNKRYDMLRGNNVEDISQYNKMHVNNKLDRIIVFIDELAELIKTSNKDITKSIISSLESLTRISRAAGINLIMGIQRPDSTVISGQIKNNVSFRICGRFIDPEPSRIMLSNDMATLLPKIRGRFILKDNDYQEFQAFYFPNSVIEVRQEETPLPTNEPTMPPIKAESPPKATKSLPAGNNIDFNFEDIEI